ncbi:hypothetical protein [Brevibacillus agri]|uniref:hypothetical protein n=1 Tax=Brevibacillus agri TaxID=51101 RepID=UPI0019D63AF1|nr:hypothetical protein [Brevibacillus agri]
MALVLSPEPACDLSVRGFIFFSSMESRKVDIDKKDKRRSPEQLGEAKCSHLVGLASFAGTLELMEEPFL